MHIELLESHAQDHERKEDVERYVAPEIALRDQGRDYDEDDRPEHMEAASIAIQSVSDMAMAVLPLVTGDGFLVGTKPSYPLPFYLHPEGIESVRKRYEELIETR